MTKLTIDVYLVQGNNKIERGCTNDMIISWVHAWNESVKFGRMRYTAWKVVYLHLFTLVANTDY